MENKISEFLKQIDREIERAEGDIIYCKKKLHEAAESDIYNYLDFGGAKYAEQLTKSMATLRTLKEQKGIFMALFQNQ